jgi:hypothetical protein
MVPRTHSLFVVPVRAFERLWMFLWENGKEFNLPFVKRQRFNGLRLRFLIHRNRSLALKTGVDNLRATL